MKQRRRSTKLLILLAAAAAAVVLLAVCRIRPVIRELAKANVSNRAAAVINQAIEEQLRYGKIDYTDLIIFEKNANGNIQALKTNMSEINHLKAQILSVIDTILLGQDLREIGLPLGNLILPELFSGRGPRLPVKVMFISASDADFRSVFREAGINQTSHQIMMDVRITMTILTPAGPETVQAESSVLVAETILVGDVPRSYVTVK